MQHIRNIETEESKRDVRWNGVLGMSDCSAYMAIEAQRMGALGFAFLRRPEHAVRGPSWLRGARASVEEHYRYAREIMGMTDHDQLYA
ncbi:hypothetical protein RHEC894_CH01042 [Rhizobium sp. CIAT894]|uniref:hypothetical protein n=1 Tax=Rhizobium sp. CIAT894 TaxID=2020312 RepID=UPI0001909FAE|nr:hypothetical protein [Rhizobium sp. CIAT894]ARM87381.1 hypothetical protein RHEC894_CH01042 [Rhizobium sp. CIAT894]